MIGDERFDLGQNRLLFHESSLSRVITRTSTGFAGDYTKLRAITRAAITWAMQSAPALNLEKLKADMAAHVARTSARKFSLAATGGKNPDFYRNFVNNGQDKRVSAEVFMGIVSALGQNPFNYMLGMDARFELPNAAVLTSAFAVLLDSLGIPPYEDERAQKLAARFPDALRSIAALQAERDDDASSPPEGVSPALDEARPST